MALLYRALRLQLLVLVVQLQQAVPVLLNSRLAARTPS